jgi:uncharacterized protein HemX
MSKIRLKIGVIEIEVEDDDMNRVEQAVDKYFQPAVDATKKQNNRLQELEEYNQQMTLFNDISANTDQSENAPMPEEQNGSKKESIQSQNPTLSEFYHKLTVKNQYEEVAVITFWYMNYGNKDVLSYDDFAIAYDELQFENVDKPNSKGLRNRLNNCRRNKRYIVAPEQGQFALARKGKDLVRELLAQSEANDNI